MSSAGLPSDLPSETKCALVVSINFRWSWSSMNFAVSLGSSTQLPPAFLSAALLM
jgi:hypothetical protein